MLFIAINYVSVIDPLNFNYMVSFPARPINIRNI